MHPKDLKVNGRSGAGVGADCQPSISSSWGKSVGSSSFSLTSERMRFDVVPAWAIPRPTRDFGRGQGRVEGRGIWDQLADRGEEGGGLESIDKSLRGGEVGFLLPIDQRDEKELPLTLPLS